MKRPESRKNNDKARTMKTHDVAQILWTGGGEEKGVEKRRGKKRRIKKRRNKNRRIKKRRGKKRGKAKQRIQSEKW